MAPRRENGVPSARTVLEVADALRWTDPGLGVSLAEHAARMPGGDPSLRAAAGRCVVASWAEVERFDEVVTRAGPLLEAARSRGDREGLAGLLVDLAGAAVGLGEDAVAARLVAPVAASDDLAARTLLRAALVRTQLAGSAGDVAGADRAAADAAPVLLRTAEPEAGLARRDLARARAAARRGAGDPGAALAILTEALSDDPGTDPDGGRRSLSATADVVEVLLDLGRDDEALDRGRAVPDAPVGPLLASPAARLRLALAERVHLVVGAHAEAAALARAATDELEGAELQAAAVRAWQVVAAAAERAGELAAALAAVRRAHELDSRARDRREPALRVLAVIAASALELPTDDAAPDASTGSVSGPTSAATEMSTTLSEMDSLLADARSSLRGGPLDDGSGHADAGGSVNGTALPRRRHHRDDAGDEPAPPAGTEAVPDAFPDALARLLAGDAEGSADAPVATADDAGGLPTSPRVLLPSPGAEAAGADAADLVAGLGALDEPLHIDPADPLGAGASWGVEGGPSAPVAADGSPRPDERRTAPRVPPAGFDPEDLDHELPLTLAGLLAEYHVPDAPVPPRRDRGRADDGTVPQRRRGAAGPTPVADDQRWTPHPDAAADRLAPPGADGNGAAAPRTQGENGARLADLLAEAMDAFRHSGPGEGTRGADVGPRPV